MKGLESTWSLLKVRLLKVPHFFLKFGTFKFKMRSINTKNKKNK